MRKSQILNPKSKRCNYYKIFLVGILTLGFWIFISGSSARAFFEYIRPPAAAGTFYPKDKKELSEEIKGYLENVKYQKISGPLIALVVPHAGTMYSGQVAAYAYKELEGRKFKRVILIGASHYQRFDGISVAEYDHCQTPLGKVKVDREFAKKLVESGEKISFLPEAHAQEHSLEVQLPFLQTVLKEEFKIVPIIFGRPSLQNCQLLAVALARHMDDETLIICSTDWSHYHGHAEAVEMDRKAIGAVLNGDVGTFVDLLAAGSAEACASPALITTMFVAPALGANMSRLLQYQNSGDVTGDKSRVVGYAAIAFAHESSPLSETDKRELLSIARAALESHLSNKEAPAPDIKEGVLSERSGVFVTLNKRGRLRGCVGYIQPYKPLFEAVAEMAVSAAVRDSRFPAVKKDELKDINIEISVLSRLDRIADIRDIEIGRDGLYIIKDGRAGLLLPQVAVEQGWGRSEFLENVCYKAGLPGDAFKDKEALLYRFSAEVFHE